MAVSLLLSLLMGDISWTSATKNKKTTLSTLITIIASTTASRQNHQQVAEPGNTKPRIKVC